MHRETKKAPGVPGLSRKHPNLGIKVPQTLRYYPTAQIRQGADRVSAPTSRCVRDGPWPFVSQRTRVLA
jgi:hypothetical protein